MSSLVNPITFRLSYVRYWNNIWSCFLKNNYSFLNQQDYYISRYIEYYLLNKKWLFDGHILDNIKNIRLKNKLNIYIYIKNQKLCSFLFKYSNWLNISEWNTSNISSLKLKKTKVKKFLKKKPFKFSFSLINIQKSRVLILKNNYIPYLFTFYSANLYFVNSFISCMYVNFYKKTKIYNKNQNYKKYKGYNKKHKYYKSYKNYKGRKFNYKGNKQSFFKKKRRIKKKSFFIKYFFIIFSFIIYKYLYFWWKILLKNKLKKILKNNYLMVNIFFIIYWLNHFSAFFLGQYIKHRLLLNYPIGHIIYNLNKILDFAKKKRIIWGFKILFSGRFTRRDRKIHKWISKGWLSYNTTYCNLDYCLTLATLLNSLCGIKIWLNKKINYNLITII